MFAYDNLVVKYGSCKTGICEGGRLREMVAYESGRSKRVNCIVWLPPRENQTVVT